MGKVRILNELLDNLTKEEILAQYRSGLYINPNVDGIVKNHYNKEFYEAVKKASFVVCDSKILSLCSRLLPERIKEAVPGSSFFSDFYFYHKDDPDCRIFLLGAMEGVAVKAMGRINEKMGRDIVVGAYSPSYGFEKKDEECRQIYEMINASGANVVLVGVGCPKQEKWIDKHKAMMPGVDIWMALGATIDFEAGNVKRAPKLWQTLYLEWFYRRTSYRSLGGCTSAISWMTLYSSGIS